MSTPREKDALILYADIHVAGDESVGIKDYHERIPINMHVEDDLDLEQFREGLQEAYANILGDACEVLFDWEVKVDVPVLQWGKENENEPNIEPPSQ